MGYPQEKAQGARLNYVDLQFPAAKKPRVRPHLQFLLGAVVLSIIISCSHQFPTSNLDVLRQEFPILQVGIFKKKKKKKELLILQVRIFWRKLDFFSRAGAAWRARRESHKWRQQQ